MKKKVIHMATESKIVKVAIPKTLWEEAFVQYVSETKEAVSKQKAVQKILERYINEQANVAGNQKAAK